MLITLFAERYATGDLQCGVQSTVAEVCGMRKSLSFDLRFSSSAGGNFEWPLNDWKNKQSFAHQFEVVRKMSEIHWLSFHISLRSPWGAFYC